MEIITAPNGVRFAFSPLLGVPHGFSTRIGGVSTLPHTASLNLSADCGDGRDCVLENLRRFCAAVGIAADGIVSPPQIHSASVRVVTDADRGRGYFRPAEFSCDGTISVTRDVSPAVRTADCVPILLSARDKEGVPFAVAAIHAGWRGTSAGIAAEAVRLLVSLGADPARICAAIGPSISRCCYEVGQDFYDAFAPDLRVRFVRADPARPGKYFADLKGANTFLLEQAGVPRRGIDVSPDCTCCLPERYYSHRFQHGVRGSLLSAISLG